jgi:hypothetical protein
MALSNTATKIFFLYFLPEVYKALNFYSPRVKSIVELSVTNSIVQEVSLKIKSWQQMVSKERNPQAHTILQKAL